MTTRSGESERCEENRNRDEKRKSDPCPPDASIGKRTLSLGSSGADVRFLQCALRQLGHDVPVEERNVETFGRGTLQALERFQTDSGLRVTGQCDELASKNLLARW